MIGETLKALRKQKGVTAKTVADDLNILPDTYRNYEVGRREPNLETLKAISDYFGVSADYLIGKDVPPPEYLTESEKDLEACILEKYKQLPESYRKKFLQGVMEAVEIQKREQVDATAVQEDSQPTDYPVATVEIIQESTVQPEAAAREGTVPHLDDDEYWAMVDNCSPVTKKNEFD